MAAKTGSARRVNTAVPHAGSSRGYGTGVPHEGSARPVAAPKVPPTQLDRLIHDHVRLGIVSALAASESLSFSELKAALDATDGNLSVHARKLEEAGYIHVSKGFAGRTPRTEYRLTAGGRRALEKYLDHMDAIIKHTRRSST